jgi:hypothetical protein
MSVVDNLTRQASRLAGDVQSSLKRARLEGERRLLQRQHRSALEELGARAYDLIHSGRIDLVELASEVAAVERKLFELDAKAREIAAADNEQQTPPAASDPVDAAFPMMGNHAPPAPSTPPTHSAGPGWDAADRFFRTNT